MTTRKTTQQKNAVPSRITWQLEETKTGFSAYSEKFPIYSSARDLESLMHQLNEAAALYFEVSEEEETHFRHTLHIDFRTFFIHYKILNARILAQRIGMSSALLSQYIRGKKNPSVSQLQRIRKGMLQISQELAGVNFY
jgi:transcriptional regulator with XRE-family HTH domain